MHIPAAESERSPDCYVVRLSGDRAALLGDVELPEDELLGWLRAKGLITYPSPLLGPLVGELPEVFRAEVLPLLEPTDLALFGRVGSASRAAVVASDLPRAGARQGGRGVPLKLQELCGSVERLAWARENGCPMQVPRPCGCVSDECGCGCGWDVKLVHEAAARGHLDVLIWAREFGFPWVKEQTDEPRTEFKQGDVPTIHLCALAAKNGRLQALRWLREHGCPWNEWTCECAASGVAVTASCMDAMFGIIGACCAPSANWIERGSCVDPTSVVSKERGVLILLTAPSASVRRRATKSRIPN